MKFTGLACAFVLAAVALAGGCSRVPEATYSLRADVETPEFPAEMAGKIAEVLTAFYGTPANPRMGLPADVESEGADATAIAVVDKPGYDRQRLQHGRVVYTRQCAACHGTTGDGQGPAAAYLNPPPRDYRLGIFKFTSTAQGSKPRRDDLRRILKYGAKGTSMPAFRFLSTEDTEAVIDYVQVLASRGELEKNLVDDVVDDAIENDEDLQEAVANYVRKISESWDRAEAELVRPLTVNPPSTSETIGDGAKAFVELDCIKCHGADMRGNALENFDVDIWKRPIRPANLAMGMLHGGRRPIDVYRRIFVGVKGNRMPAFGEANAASGETPEQRSERIWHLVHFVTAVVEAGEVPAEARAVIDATRESLKTPAVAPDAQPAAVDAATAAPATVPPLARAGSARSGSATP